MYLHIVKLKIKYLPCIYSTPLLTSSWISQYDLEVNIIYIRSIMIIVIKLTN